MSTFRLVPFGLVPIVCPVCGTPYYFLCPKCLKVYVEMLKHEKDTTKEN